MSTCSNCRQDGPTQLYSFALGRRVTLLCDECEIALVAIGMTLTPVERRVAALPVATERRRFIAPWTRRNLARDESGRAA